MVSHPVVAHPVVHTPHCSTVEEVVQAEICRPAFETTCSKEHRTVIEIVETEKCQDITTPVCTESVQLLDKEVCVNTYKVKEKAGEATSVDISIGQKCKTEISKVCQATAAYGYLNYGPHHYCKDAPHQTCYQVPQVSPKKEPVTLSAPEPETSCQNTPISVPVITCEDIVIKKCIKVPEPVEKVEKVDKCEATLAEVPSCKVIKLSLPKKVCVTHG